MTNFNISCIQINSQNNLEKNLEKACAMIDLAIKDQPQLIALPENISFIGSNREELFNNSFTLENNPALNIFQQKAKETKTWLLIGSLPIKINNSKKLNSRSFLIDPFGQINASYNKIHLYDVKVSGGESHLESSKFKAGNKVVVAKSDFANIGMTICYDLRFPHLYRKLALSGADIIAVPSAFTYFTGQAHWEVLLRARAIENSCYIIAPDQTGYHGNRRTYGHSMIIDPWGEIIAKAGEDEQIITARIDLQKTKQIRQQLPSLNLNKRFYAENI